MANCQHQRRQRAREQAKHEHLRRQQMRRQAKDELIEKYWSITRTDEYKQILCNTLLNETGAGALGGHLILKIMDIAGTMNRVECNGAATNWKCKSFIMTWGNGNLHLGQESQDPFECELDYGQNIEPWTRCIEMERWYCGICQQRTVKIDCCRSQQWVGEVGHCHNKFLKKCDSFYCGNDYCESPWRGGDMCDHCGCRYCFGCIDGGCRACAATICINCKVPHHRVCVDGHDSDSDTNIKALRSILQPKFDYDDDDAKCDGDEHKNNEHIDGGGDYMQTSANEHGQGHSQGGDDDDNDWLVGQANVNRGEDDDDWSIDDEMWDTLNANNGGNTDTNEQETIIDID